MRVRARAGAVAGGGRVEGRWRGADQQSVMEECLCRPCAHASVRAAMCAVLRDADGRAGEKGVRVRPIRRGEHVQAGMCQSCREHKSYVLGRGSRGASAIGSLLRCPVLLDRER